MNCFSLKTNEKNSSCCRPKLFRRWPTTLLCLFILHERMELFGGLKTEDTTVLRALYITRNTIKTKSNISNVLFNILKQNSLFIILQFCYKKKKKIEKIMPEKCNTYYVYYRVVHVFIWGAHTNTISKKKRKKKYKKKKLEKHRRSTV